MTNEDKEWSLLELAAESGIPARTIRFYISRGALDGPTGAGRGACYGSAHLARLREIQRRQNSGETLAEICREVAPELNAVPPESWWRFTVASDVIVEVKQGAAPWRMNRVREAIAEMVRKIGEE